MAHTKAAGTTKLGRDSISKRLGVKLFGGQAVNAGNVIVRQHGTKIIPGKNVKLGKDDTIYAVRNGVIKFRTIRKLGFDGRRRMAKVIDVL